ncbi:hypothetical protein ACIO1C_05405 [Streptomyces sp. NPDC087420]|uniref:hypothetical protein n=1 Tax=Streptomyces sp. NPDC087420 TaxID=3365785 RepID=UPI0038376063
MVMTEAKPTVEDEAFPEEPRIAADEAWPKALTFEVKADTEEQGRAPATVTLLRPVKNDVQADQLLLDRVPVQRDMWSFDEQSKALSWSGPYGGGRILFGGDHRSGHGILGRLGSDVGVELITETAFVCDISRDAGAQLLTQGKIVLGLTWDVESDKWKKATWSSDDVLRFDYSVDSSGGKFDPTATGTNFSDLRCEDCTWNPGEKGTDFSFEIDAGVSHGGSFIYKLNFAMNSGAVTGDSCPDETPLYPYRLQCDQPASVDTLAGAILVGAPDATGTVYGLKGTYVDPVVSGYYRLRGGEGTAPSVLGVFGGRLYADDKPVAQAFVRGRQLVWKDLSAAARSATGLPRNGMLSFSVDGSTASEDGLSACRMAGSQVRAFVVAQAQRYPALSARLALPADDNAVAGSGDLDINTLMVMTPYSKNTKGEWSDDVQAGVREDLHTLMSCCVPSDQWSTLFPGMEQPTATGELATVLATRVKGKEARPWYESLSTRVLAQGLAGGTADNERKLNGPRAAMWLKDQVAVNDIYRGHSSLLFAYHWKLKNPLFQQYLDDQSKHTVQQGKDIDGYVEGWLKAMDTCSTLTGPERQKMKTLIEEAGQNGKSGRYWAFGAYCRLTHPRTWANLQALMTNPSRDQAALTLMVQQNVTLLTALDSSGYFARKYFESLQTVLSSVFLLQSISYYGKATDYDLILEYLKKFVETNLASENPEIRKHAETLKALLAEESQTHFIQSSVTAMQRAASTKNVLLPFGKVAAEFVDKWYPEHMTKSAFKGFGKFFGTILASGMSGLVVFNMLGPYRDWKNLNAEQRAEIITNTVQLGTEALSSVVTGGVKVYAIFTADGLSAWQRMKTLAWATLGGQPEALSESMSKMGSSLARWLGGVAEDAAAAEEASFFARMMGNSLTKFLATRIGPLFIITGMAFSIYELTRGGSPMEIASQVLSLVSGALALFALVGEYLLASVLSEAAIAVIIPVIDVLAVACALAGLVLALFAMYKTPPNPVDEWIRKYAEPAGLTTRSHGSAIDYAISYNLKEQEDLEMLGAQLSNGNKFLVAGQDGAITPGPADNTGAVVWGPETNGLGLTRFTALVGKGKTLVRQYLTVMKNDTVVFADESTKDKPTPDAVTQYWLAHVTDDATLTKDDNLKSLPFTLQPVYADASGSYSPSAAKGYLALNSSSGVRLVEESGTTWTLTMAGRAPEAMTMDDIVVLTNTQSVTYTPVLGGGSKPMTFKIKDGRLPSFMKLDADTGAIRADDTITEFPVTTYTMVATNNLGSTEAAFTIEAKAS